MPFSKFISGKLLDSAIIGVLCYICLLIMKMPYTLLVSVFVGLTNIIPFFGPFIGAIPSVIIIALADPIKGIYFLIFIFILQQVDGNIIGPKILGDSTVIYYIIDKTVDYCLRKRKLPEDTDEYIRLEKVDEKTNEIVRLEEPVEEASEKKELHIPSLKKKEKK